MDTRRPAARRPAGTSAHSQRHTQFKAHPTRPTVHEVLRQSKGLSPIDGLAQYFREYRQTRTASTSTDRYSGVACPSSHSEWSFARPHSSHASSEDKEYAEQAPSSCGAPSAKADGHLHGTSSLLTGALPVRGLSEQQRHDAETASEQLLAAILRSDKKELLEPSLAPDGGTRGAGSAVARADVAAAAVLLPLLSWQWSSFAAVEPSIERGVAGLLREALLVHRAACDASASISEVVAWCLASCSAASVALAALWGQQRRRQLQPRLAGFYSALLQQLGLGAAEAGADPEAAVLGSGFGLGTGHACSGSQTEQVVAYGWSRAAPAVVMCGYVARTADIAAHASGHSGDGGGGGSGHERAGGVDDAGPTAARSNGATGRNGSSGMQGGAGGWQQPQPEVVLVGGGSAGAEAMVAAVSPGVGDADVRQRRPLFGSAGDSTGSSAPEHGAVSATGASGLSSEAGPSPKPRPGLNGMAEADTGAAPGRPARRGPLLQRPARSFAPNGPVDALEAVDASYPPVAASPLLPPPGTAPASLGVGLRARLPSRYVPVRLIPTGPFALQDALTGQRLSVGPAVPPTGPVVISNDPRVFPGTEYLLSDFRTEYDDKLAMRLEYIVDRSTGDDEVTLQLYNISRVRRKRTENCRMYVNGKAVNVGDPGMPLLPGDEVWFGSEDFAFRMEAMPETPSAVADALDRLQVSVDSHSAGGSSNRAGRDQLQQHAEQEEQGRLGAGAGAGSSGGMESGDGEMSTGELSALTRKDPATAERLLRQRLAGDPEDAAAWLLWAQMAARVEKPTRQGKARVLFRAAAAAARGLLALPPPPPALEVLARRAQGGGARSGSGGNGATSTMSDGEDPFMLDESYSSPAAVPGPAYGIGLAGAYGGPGRRDRHNWLLVQALGNWAKHEWRLRMYGSARHLFRTAVDEAARHPKGVAGGGGGAILHHWASQEFEALNVRNARIIIAEALRKCPVDAGMLVLAASIELEAGNLELAKKYCQSAYRIDRYDKYLFLVWPRVEAALGDRVKARLLFERGLDAHPMNTKIMNLFARFAADEGAYREAAALFDRALGVDPLSPGPGVANRCAWASLEADLGNLALARRLVEDGLAAHPRSPPLLVTLAKVARLEGRYADAWRHVRDAQAVAGAFNAAVMNERAKVLKALGEDEMAANLFRHVSSVNRLTRMKQQGYWGSEAWRAFVDETRTPEQQQVVAAARRRQRALGWVPDGPYGKPAPVGVAVGDGRRRVPVEDLQWEQLQALRQQRAEARRLAKGFAAQQAAAAAGSTGGEEVPGPGMDVGARAHAGSAPAARPRRPSESGEYDNEKVEGGFDDGYDEDDNVPVGVPTLNAVRRQLPDDTIDDG